MHGGSMCALCNVFMFNKVPKEQSQTSFHGSQYMCTGSWQFRRTFCPLWLSSRSVINSPKGPHSVTTMSYMSEQVTPHHFKVSLHAWCTFFFLKYFIFCVFPVRQTGHFHNQTNNAATVYSLFFTQNGQIFAGSGFSYRGFSASLCFISLKGQQC